MAGACGWPQPVGGHSLRWSEPVGGRSLGGGACDDVPAMAVPGMAVPGWSSIAASGCAVVLPAGVSGVRMLRLGGSIA